MIRDFPLESIHPQAFKAAEAARCAGEQGKYLEMHERLFANQRALRPADLPKHAEGLGLDAAKFAECLTSERQAGAIRKDLQEGRALGIRGTPTFFIGLTDSAGKTIKPVRRFSGAMPFSAFKEELEKVLASP